MRKALALFVALCMFLSLCTGILTPLSTARADGTAVAALSLTPSAGTTTWVNGQEFSLTLHIDISGCNVNALATTITYDPAVLQVTGAEAANENPLPTPIELDWTKTAGYIYVANAKPSGMDGLFATSGDVAVIHFKTLAQPAASTPVGFADGTQILQPNASDLDHPTNVFTGATGVAVEVKAHHIMITAGAHGSVSPFGVNGDVTEADNATPTFTFTPDSGYEVAGVIVNSVPVTTANTYTFAPVTTDQTLGVTFRMTAATALAAVNNASNANNYAAVTTALVDNADVLGLNLNTGYNTLIADRRPAVANDIYCSKPEGGYTLDQLQEAFKEIVATRIVFQNSMILVNNATPDKPLTDLTYVTMLIDNLQTVKHYTHHSGITIADKIAQLQALVNRYNALPAAGKTAALLAVSGTDYASSTGTLNALSNALAAQETAVATALAAVNNASNANNYAAVTTALVSNATTLGLDLTNYNMLTPDGRKSAVANDIYCSKPDGGYTLTGLQNAFNAIVATRLVCQKSLDKVNAATTAAPLTSLDYVQDLLTEFNRVKAGNFYTYHSGMTIQQKIDQLTDLMTRFGKLSADRQAAALKAVSSADYASSTLSLNALDAALTTEEHDTVTITVNSSNGSVSPSGAQIVLHNGNLTLTITPAQYYYLYSITRNGVETPQPAENRNRGSVATVTLTGIDTTTGLTINIYRRGDIAGNGASSPDGSVGIYDVAELIKEWRSPGTGLLADLNCDGKVDIIDVSMMMSLWLQP